jgi:FAD/FMN-containing dehydrogenase
VSGDLIEALRKALGAEAVLDAREDVARFEQDGRQAGGRALAVVRPQDAEGVAATLRLAAQAGVTVTPQGARTGLVAAGLPDDAGGMLVLSLERMNRAPAIDPVNRTAEVEAGVLLSQLNAAAAEHGLHFPIDLGADPSVGGMVAANTGGARFLRFGDVRRNVLGLEVVAADGAGPMRLGGALWKNNAGLDLKQLFIGASGATGVVTGATLALQPLPASSVTALAALSDPMAALDLLTVLEARFGALLTAFEGMSRNALGHAFGHVARLQNPFADIPPYAVLIELSSGPVLSTEALEEALGEALAGLMEQDGSPVLDVAADRGQRLWAIRHAVPEGLRAAGQVIACDIAVRRGDVMRLRAEAAADVANRWPELEVCDFGHIGDGGLHFNMVWPKAAGPAPAGLAEAVRGHVFARTVEDFDGSFSAEHGVGPRNIESYRRHTPPTVRRLAGSMQALLAPVALGRVDFG